MGRPEPGAAPRRRPAVTPLRDRLRLIVITDRAAAHPKDSTEVVEAALDAGAPAIQLRDKERSARELLPVARELRMRSHAYGALFFVNDRLDVALAAGADGAHLGPDDLPIAAARRIVPRGFLLGYSTDDPEEAMQAEADGADYLGCGTIWTTSSKGNAGDAIGPAGLARVAGAVSIPVVGIGGVTRARLSALQGTGAAGVAVIGDIMGAEDPAGAVRAYLSASF